jgi:predicted double-glycine peptidase
MFEQLFFREWLIVEEKVRIPLPKVQQVSDYDCGPASLRAICQYFKVGPKSHKEFIKECETSKKYGTRPEDLIRIARKYGLDAKEYRNMSLKSLENFLDEGKPVMVTIQAWGDKKYYDKLESGHYAVAIGYDQEKIYFEDPSVHKRKRGALLKEEFLDRWKDRKRNGEVLKQYGIVMWKKEDNKDSENLSASRKID